MNDSSAATSSYDNMAAYYDQFLGPLYFEPYALEVGKRIKPLPVSLVLEIAAGTGRVTRHIREHIPFSAKLIASDINEEMLAEAKKKLGNLDVDWQYIDAQQLPFDDNTIDLVICCFGYMFVPDRPKAFAEAYRVLKPGGIFLFTTWDKLEHNAASATSTAIAAKYLEGPLPESSSIPTSMSDEDIIRPLAEDAGFSKIVIEKVHRNLVCPTAKEAAQGFVYGGTLYNDIQKRNPAVMDEIKIKLEKELAEKFGAAPMTAPMSAVFSQAWK